jgi:hypothetical protein
MSGVDSYRFTNKVEKREKRESFSSHALRATPIPAVANSLLTGRVPVRIREPLKAFTDRVLNVSVGAVKRYVLGQGLDRATAVYVMVPPGCTRKALLSRQIDESSSMPSSPRIDRRRSDRDSPAKGRPNSAGDHLRIGREVAEGFSLVRTLRIAPGRSNGNNRVGLSLSWILSRKLSSSPLLLSDHFQDYRQPDIRPLGPPSPFVSPFSR